MAQAPQLPLFLLPRPDAVDLVSRLSRTPCNAPTQETVCTGDQYYLIHAVPFDPQKCKCDREFSAYAPAKKARIWESSLKREDEACEQSFFAQFPESLE
jgi:hypothetical protein